MESKHFSHDHSLTLYHMAEGSETVCSGCKLPGLTTVYMCWQCQYFLHQQCFEAKRSIIHPSHPTHPLTLLPCSTYPSSSFLCNSCNHSGAGFSYACSHCDFNIHLHCAYTTSPPIENQPNSNKTQVAKHFSHPHALRQSKIKKEEEEDDRVLCSGCEHAISKTKSPVYTCTKSKFCNFRLHKSCFDLPKEIKHRSHMAHPLTLLSAPPYESYSPDFTCNACFKKGYSFLYHCSSCKFDLHVNCAMLPDSVKRDDHEHPLSLLLSSPYEKPKDGGREVVFMCEVCEGWVDSNCWVYYCEECDFGVDVGCINVEKDKEGEEDDSAAVADDDSAAVTDDSAAVAEDDGLTQVERLMKMQTEFQIMQMQMQMNQRLNQSIIGMGQSLRYL